MNFTKRFRHADRDAQPQLRDLRRLTRTQNVRPERRQRLRAEKQPPLLARHAQAGHIGIAEPFRVTQPLERQQMPARQFPSGRLLQRTHAHRARQRQQLGDRDALRGHLPSQKIRSQPTEKRLVLAQERCRVGRVLHEGGIHALKRRHGMVPDAVAGIGIGRVRAVLHVRDGMGGQVGLRLRARRVQHRAQELAALRRDAGQAAQAAAAREVEQQRLGVVIRRVRRGDPVVAVRLRALRQERIAQLARGGLSAHAAHGRNIAAPGIKRHAQFLTLRAHERLVAVALRAAQPVVEVRTADGKAALRAQRRHLVQEVHGVHPAGHGTQHTHAGHDGINSHRRRTSSRWPRRMCTPAAT